MRRAVRTFNTTGGIAVSTGPFFPGPIPPQPPRPRTILGGRHTSGPDLGPLAKILGLPTKRRIFISYHHHGDRAYKEAFARFAEEFELLEDRSLERLLDSDDTEYVEREIREEYISGTSVTIVLCGAATWQRRFVDREIRPSLIQQSGLIGVQLPTLTATLPGGTVSVPARLHDNIVTGYALWRSWRDIASPVVLRRWVEEALGRDKRLIDNCRPKMRANGQVRSHPLHGWSPSIALGMLLSARSRASITA